MVTKHRVPEAGERFSNLTIDQIVNLKDFKKGSGKGALVTCSCGTSFGPIAISKLYGYKTSKPVESCKPCSAKIAGGKMRANDDTRSKLFVYGNYKRHAKKRNLDFLLEKEDFYKMIILSCTYCGDSQTSYSNPPKEAEWGTQFRYTGIDRINPKIGYVEGNVQPCCIKCNRAKSDMTEEDFALWIGKVIDNWGKVF